jgi:hypothetical protein
MAPTIAEQTLVSCLRLQAGVESVALVTELLAGNLHYGFNVPICPIHTFCRSERRLRLAPSSGNHLGRCVLPPGNRPYLVSLLIDYARWHQCLYIPSDTNVCTNGTYIGVMPTRGHDTKVCTYLETKVCAVKQCHVRTLVAVGQLSLCTSN